MLLIDVLSQHKYVAQVKNNLYGVVGEERATAPFGKHGCTGDRENGGMNPLRAVMSVGIVRL